MMTTCAYTSVSRGEATVPWPSPQTLKMKNCKAKPSSFSKSKAGFLRVFGVRPGFRSICERFFGFREASDLTGTKMHIFRRNFENFSRGMPPDCCIMVVPSALPKLICGVTRL